MVVGGSDLAVLWADSRMVLGVLLMALWIEVAAELGAIVL